MVRNILFIMYDQLRHDYLSCAGHKTLHTPHMDRLAAMGTRFTNAYVQSPVCGASRMSFYTGRYVSSHGAAWNGFPLKVGEETIGDHLRELGVASWLIGKTHMRVDAKGMDRLGISRDGVIGARVAQCGFDVWEREDGLRAEGPDGPYDPEPSPYNAYLKARGYGGENPWHDYANSAGIDGEIASGWLMQHADRPANIKEEDSETPWLTTRAIAFLDSPAAAQPWLAHLSYIKPHWPYIVPAPYHDMYGHNAIQPVNRAPCELEDMHPVYEAFHKAPAAQAFCRDAVRNKVIPAYMGLIKQCDDQLGRLLRHLEASGRMEDTMIVLTSDHGDYLGDHWLGEKDLFHAPSVKVPLIIFHPEGRPGQVVDALVESIDLAPTFVDAMGGSVPAHVLEGRSLLPWLMGETPAHWRDYVISEYDYSATPIRNALGVSLQEARLFMVADERYTFIHAEGGFRPMLFDRANDPEELYDLGTSRPEVLERMYARLQKWALRPSQRTTRSHGEILAGGGNTGVIIGAYDAGDVSAEDMAKYPTRRG